MKSKTFYFAVLLISFLTLISTASAACSSCGGAIPSTGGDCPTCGDSTANDETGECTVAITDFSAVADCSETPCTVSFAGAVEGDATKIKYYLVNANGKVVCSKTATCGEYGCTATCTVFKPGTYTAVMKVCGADGCCVTQSKEVVVDSSSCGSCNSDNGRHHGWNNFREFHHFRGFGHR
jgi:RNA polymerase subunit RPABC4/transcription elongation factor Spt4